MFVNRNNIPSEAIKQYRKDQHTYCSLTVTFADMKPCFIQEKRPNYERYRVVPEYVTRNDENKINKLNQCLIEKGNHVVRLSSYFYDETNK